MMMDSLAVLVGAAQSLEHPQLVLLALQGAWEQAEEAALEARVLAVHESGSRLAEQPRGHSETC